LQNAAHLIQMGEKVGWEVQALVRQPPITTLAMEKFIRQKSQQGDRFSI
jgi:hypothetical protein